MTLLLIVEDNDMNADMLTRRLRRKGYEIALACDGGEAVTMAQECRPALILMDLSLPVMDGYEATRRIKESGRCDAPIIALTAHALSEDRDKALAAGCDDYETKPVNFPRLLEKIERFLAAS
ncbi:FOG: CheY-like receiver [Hahella chejuensis KCTC 2396]|uniref:FOG: CheY-like receiver n=1 Tax=Hahella chejuensis (strain KCTC 2396) TaxID=349521 RepID=Q2SEF1_HAHCH|nr:response regulator [Hahella chejuensis]ABC30973.1 FOG: CheY-like receiver [Hahella chejuensis KCTC 2396]